MPAHAGRGAAKAARARRTDVRGAPRPCAIVPDRASVRCGRIAPLRTPISSGGTVRLVRGTPNTKVSGRALHAGSSLVNNKNRPCELHTAAAAAAAAPSTIIRATRKLKGSQHLICFACPHNRLTRRKHKHVRNHTVSPSGDDDPGGQ